VYPVPSPVTVVFPLAKLEDVEYSSVYVSPYATDPQLRLGIVFVV
jgi:hypothetical protein